MVTPPSSSRASSTSGGSPFGLNDSVIGVDSVELVWSSVMRAWVRTGQATLAYWDDRPRAAAELAIDGWQYTPELGTVRVALGSHEARARARLRDHRAAEDALARAEQAREQVTGEDEFGGQFTFPVQHQFSLVAEAQLWLGGQSNYAEGERLAGQAVELYQAEPPEKRELGWLCHARLDKAVAHLGRDDLEAAASSVGDVLAVATQRRSATVAKRLQQLAALLERPRYQATGLALGLRDEIRAFTTPAAPAALPGGEGA